MKPYRIILGILLTVLLTYTAQAQFISAELGVDGLTCSACTRSVEMSIRKLDFVKDVQMDLDNTKGIITFKDGANVDIEKLAKAVINAGFSVRYLNATFKSDGVIKISDNFCFAYGGSSYQFVKVSPTDLQNQIVFKFIGKEFLNGKEFKKWKDNLKAQCQGKSTYFVTL